MILISERRVARAYCGVSTDVRTFAVDPDAQRRGVGKVLLQDILADADRQDLPVYLESSEGLPQLVSQVQTSGSLTRTSNAVGTKLYRKHGFVACGPLAAAASNPAVSVCMVIASRVLRFAWTALTRNYRRKQGLPMRRPAKSE